MSMTVENTLLSKLGTAEDVLARVPGIIKKQDGFEVFGKGEPLIYINGRQMRDVSELDRLKSEDIKSVELITTPGARYDATVRAVVKIRISGRIPINLTVFFSRFATFLIFAASNI